MATDGAEMGEVIKTITAGAKRKWKVRIAS